MATTRRTRSSSSASAIRARGPVPDASSRNRPSTGAMRLTAVEAVPRSTVKNESGSELTDAW